MTLDLLMCIRSKKYSSQNGDFVFRYPNFYPLTYKTGVQMHEEYFFDKGKYHEFINFSSEFYPNAGGDCLGAIVVTSTEDMVSLEQYKEKIISDYEKLPADYKSSPPQLATILIGGSSNFEDFKAKVDVTFERAEILSEKYGVPWAITELWIGKRYDDKEINRDIYYDYVFNKAKTTKNLIGIVIDTWNVDEPGFETSAKDTDSEQIIKEFFEKWE
jgi:hypothetical protein